MEGKQKPSWKPWRPPEKKARWGWTGFGDKTLWDWMQLVSALAIPVVLAVAGFWFTAQQDDQQQDLENQRAASERKLEEQRAQGEALQAYLDEMGRLMIDRDLQDSEEGDVVYTLAQARTTTVIGRLDADKNNSVMRFLADAELIGIGDSSTSLLNGADLHEADLAGVDLRSADLSGANLSGAVLSGAELGKADMQGANLESADLSHADLNYAQLQYSNLKHANLTNADLRGAELENGELAGAKGLSEAFLMDTNLKDAFLESVDLSGAALWGANLENAELANANLTDAYLQDADLTNADLSGADLGGATGTTNERLNAALSLSGVIMPDESKGTNSSEQEVNRTESAIQLAVDKYYWAVDRKVWAYTYDNLDYKTRSMFTKEEWFLKNQWYTDQSPGHLSSIDVEVILNTSGTRADVTVSRRFREYEGQFQERSTVFVYEDGTWKHRFVGVELELYMPDATYEEFLAKKEQQ